MLLDPKITFAEEDEINFLHHVECIALFPHNVLATVLTESQIS